MDAETEKRLRQAMVDARAMFAYIAVLCRNGPIEDRLRYQIAENCEAFVRAADTDWAAPVPKPPDA